MMNTNVRHDYRAWLYTLDLSELRARARECKISPEQFDSNEDLIEAISEYLEAR